MILKVNVFLLLVGLGVAINSRIALLSRELFYSPAYLFGLIGIGTISGALVFILDGLSLYGYIVMFLFLIQNIILMLVLENPWEYK